MSERWYAANYDAHGTLVLSAPVSSSVEVGAMMDRDPARYRERLAVVERGAVRTLALATRTANGEYEFKKGPRLP
jgi:hypothetical protein